MYLADYHTHSTCSEDGNMTLLQLATAAEKAGLREVCVTDHWNLIDQTGRLLPGMWNHQPALAQWLKLRNKFAGRVELRLGVEVGNGTLFSHEVAQSILLPQLDFVIGSIHNQSQAMGGIGVYTAATRCKTDGDARALMDDYFVATMELIADNHFDVLGHVVYPIRYINPRHGIKITDYMDEINAVLRAIIAQGKGIELNTSVGTTIQPWLPVLKAYKQLGGEVITLGSDAHSTHELGAGLAEGQALLLQQGFRYQTVYRGRTPAFVKL